MIFNPWRKYPRHKPKEEGWYLCTLSEGEVMDLCFLDHGDGVWLDKRRATVFEGYKVYKAGREPVEYNRVHDDGLCDRTEYVVAWKRLPKEWRGFAKIT